MTTSGIVEHNPDDMTYRLPQAHAALLTRAALPDNMAALGQWLGVLASVEDRLVDAFRDGKGVPYQAYHRFHEVMAEESMQTVVAPLFDHILPLLGDDMMQRLEQGITVLDAGCGSGQALNAMARRFPGSTFVGIDLCEPAIDQARKTASENETTNIKFRVADDADMPFDDDMFDLIVTFDVIHDQARPDQFLREMFRVLKPEGRYLAQDIRGGGSHEADKQHPMGTFVYTISCMHCMSVSLAQGGMGLGAAWGEPMAVKMLGEAGFENIVVNQLEHDPMNNFYVMKKPARVEAKTLEPAMV
jgi:SAM-dependent methyltransferase